MKKFLVNGLVRKHFNFLSNLFNLENPSRLTLKHEPPRKHFIF